MPKPLALANLARFARIGQGLWPALVLACVLAMHTVGAVHAVLHATHLQAVHASDQPAFEHRAHALEAEAARDAHPSPLSHDAGGLFCLALDTISTAAAPLLAWPVLVLVWPLGALVLPAVPGTHLAFLFLHPPAARAPPWF